MGWAEVIVGRGASPRSMLPTTHSLQTAAPKHVQLAVGGSIVVLGRRLYPRRCGPSAVCLAIHSDLPWTAFSGQDYLSS